MLEINKMHKMKRPIFLFIILLAAATAMAQKHVSDLVVSPPFGGGTIKWYDAATGGNQIMNPGATVLVTGTTYYATQTLNEVESTVRTAVTVTLDAIPAAPDAIAGGAANVCINAATPAFTDNTSGGTWSIAAGSGTASITQGGVVTGLTGGTVNVIYTTAANAKGCTNFATIPLTVYSSFTAGAIATAGETLCAGGNPGVIGSPSPAGGGDGTITYTWKSSVSGDFTDAVVLSGNNSATYTPAAGLTQTTSYRRYANDVTCNPDPALSAGTWVVTITPLPTPTFTAQPGATANTGADVTYTTQSGKSAYVWTFPGNVTTDYTITSGGTSTDNTVTLQYLTLGGKIITINYTYNGCTAVSATSSTETIVANIKD